MTEGICPFAFWLPGPPEKVYQATPTHAKTCVTIHSGEFDVVKDGQVLANVLWSPRQASWPFTITKPSALTGKAILFQHYKAGSTCWHCGWPGNLWAEGIELEGFIGIPDLVVGDQYDLLVRLLRWLKEYHGWEEEWGLSMVDANSLNYLDALHTPATLWEHNWIQRPYTDCQVFSKGRINARELLAELRKKEEPIVPTKEQWHYYKEEPRRDFERVIAAMYNVQAAWPLSDEDKANEDRAEDEDNAWDDLMIALRELKENQIDWRGLSWP